MKYVVALSQVINGTVTVEATSFAEAKREALLAVENCDVDWYNGEVFVDEVDKEEM